VISKKTNFILSTYLVFIFVLFGCSDLERIIQINGSTMGTQYHISIVIKESSPSSKNLKQAVDKLLLIINQQMSTYRKDSEISHFNQYKKTDWFPVSKDFAYVVSAALDVSKQTNGAFNITISPLVDLWGFGSKAQYTVPTEQQIAELLPHTGFQHLKVQTSPAALRKDDTQIHIDLSAIAKGFAVDKVSTYLSTKGFKNHLVEIGGEVRASGVNASGKKWKIAIEQPNKKKQQVNKIITISDKALATSGDYRNFYIKNKVRYSHMIDPKTGSPTKHQLASVTVIHNSTMYADAYATALMVIGEKAGKDFTKKNKLNVNMIIRDKVGSFSNWSNLN